MPGSMTILGLDPGSRYTGFGVVAGSGSRVRLIDQGRIVLPPSRPLAERLGLLSRRLDEILDRHRPDIAVLEGLFSGVNVRSLIVLAQARGALLAALSRAELEICEYTPSQIKSAVTGSGRADKEQVAKMVRMILGYRDELSVDASDALAAAICCSQRAGIERRVARSALGKRPVNR